MTDSLLEFVLETVLLQLLLLVLKMFDTEFGARMTEERLEVLLLETLNEDLLDQFANGSFLDFELSSTCEELGEDGVVVTASELLLDLTNTLGTNPYFSSSLDRDVGSWFRELVNEWEFDLGFRALWCGWWCR